jgi:ligand-binding sensor domain-containing protein/signal transduction histidine kinase
MSRLRRIGLLIFLTCMPLAAQDAPSTDVPGLVSLRLQPLGIDEGLSQATARALAQDGDGMLWIGTQDGLNRYDGQDLRVFRRDPTRQDSLSDNHVTALAVDPNGDLWVGTQGGGLGRYVADDASFRNYPVGAAREDAVADVPVHAIAAASDGRLWVASGRGHLQRLDAAQQRFEEIQVPQQAQVRVLLPLLQGDMLIGTSEGLWRWRARDASLQPWAPELGLGAIDVQTLARDADERIWVGTADRGAILLDPDGRPLRSLRARDGLAGDDVRAVLVDRAQRVWIGTYTGMSRIDAEGAAPRTWRRDVGRRDGLSSERVHALLQDRDGIVWIGTWLGGVHLYLPGSEAFREYRSVIGDARALPGNAVRCLLAEPDGTLWLGVQEGGGLVHFDLTRGVLQRHEPQAGADAALASDRVQAIARDRDGDLWVGFVDAGLDRLRRDGRFEHLRSVPGDVTTPQGDNVLTLHVDRLGTLWVGYQDAGMDSRCRGCDGFERYRYDPADRHTLPGQAIGAIHETRRGELWVGARPGGLSRLDRSAGRFVPIQDLLPPGAAVPSAISTITESLRGELWVGTQGSGVVRLTPQDDGRYTSRAYTYRDGLAAEAIGSIVEDDTGAMWISTTLGISRIEPATGRIENFSARAGAQADGYFIGAGARLPDASIVFGGLRGVTQFRPEQIATRSVLQRPVITDLRVFRSQSGDLRPDLRYRRGRAGAPDRLWLGAGSGGFGFSVSALTFVYRLDPLDRDWIEASARQRNAGYPHLAPGDYRLRLRTRYPGEAYGPEREVDVRLDPLWWQSAWARAAAALAVLVPLGLWVWNRRQRGIERSRAQAVLTESEKRLAMALWGTGDEFWDADLRSGELIRINPLEHLKVTHEASAPTLSAFTPFVHPDDLPGFTTALQAHASGASDDFDYSYRSQDQHGAWRWLRSRGRSVERDADGKAVRMAGVTEDITDLREYERTLERVNQDLEGRVSERTSDLMLLNRELVRTIDQLKLTQHQLVESEKLAALGGLVAGIAHEVNTPLGVGVTAASHLEQQARAFERRLDAGDATPDDVAAFRAVVMDCSSMVLRNLQRADRMIRSFKQVAVDQASEQPRRIDLRAYIDEILMSLQPAMKRSRHPLEIDVPENLVVTILPGALYQIVVNLVMNSITHAFEGIEQGGMRIRARREGGVLVLEYSDDGCGMSEEVRKRIFEPFFTTRRGQGGSGLGMHIVYTLAVQALGGSIECETAPGEGARFVLRIPVPDAI